MLNLQEHKLQLHPTLNVSPSYSDTEGNNATQLITKHNSLVDTIQSELTQSLWRQIPITSAEPLVQGYATKLKTCKLTTSFKLAPDQYMNIFYPDGVYQVVGSFALSGINTPSQFSLIGTIGHEPNNQFKWFQNFWQMKGSQPTMSFDSLAVTYPEGINGISGQNGQLNFFALKKPDSSLFGMGFNNRLTDSFIYTLDLVATIL